MVSESGQDLRSHQLAHEVVGPEIQLDPPLHRTMRDTMFSEDHRIFLTGLDLLSPIKASFAVRHVFIPHNRSYRTANISKVAQFHFHNLEDWRITLHLLDSSR